jgi:WD40 repeat protein
LGPAEDAGDGFDGVIWSLEFLPDGSLLVYSQNSGIRRWNLETMSSEKIYDGGKDPLELLPDGRRVVFTDSGSVNILDLESREVRQRQWLVDDIFSLALSSDGELMATGHVSGVVLVGRVSGGEPYRLYGHESRIFNLAFSPDGSMIASSDTNGVVRIRPVPDLSKPPLGGLPLDELLAKLDTHTNVRMVRDEESRTGWTQEIGPFQGWAEMPEW